jgi:valyl-tRNA synthetase
MYAALEAGLRLLHPFMPFVTEELWQRLPRRASDTVPSIMLAPYPDTAWAGKADLEAEATMDRVLAVVRETRDLRLQRGLKPNQAADLMIACSVRIVRLCGVA